MSGASEISQLGWHLFTLCHLFIIIPQFIKIKERIQKYLKNKNNSAQEQMKRKRTDSTQRGEKQKKQYHP